MPFYSYSEPFSYGVSTVTGSYDWSMTGVLPNYSGLTVNSVVYQYTTVKDPKDSLLVNIQNLNTNGLGYVFRKTDDWTGIPGNTINKVVPVNDIPINYWGKGSITTEGGGKVVNPSVGYTYRIDYGASLLSPKPAKPQAITEYNALEDEAVKQSIKETDRELYEKKNESSPEQTEKISIEKRREATLTISNNALLQAMTMATNIAPYYSITIPGGVYKETIQLNDKPFPDNRSMLRNQMAQERLHEQLVNMQYNKE